jgi:hypothetical protein
MKQFRVRQEEQFGEIWLDRTLSDEEEIIPAEPLIEHSHE